MPSPHKKISCQNQSKSSTTLLTWHTTRATHQCKCSFWPRFTEILCFSYLCVKFHHSECIFTIYQDHFSSSPNYGRGVMFNLFLTLTFTRELMTVTVQQACISWSSEQRRYLEEQGVSWKVLEEKKEKEKKKKKTRPTPLSRVRS